ncbi:portal vertex protein [uncultured Caudovirales phage]|uniref:Portal protein n=1 Tax=uncultured Caudovirales phage TaxID=2100421 RepID=A0A6J5M832_9CAUD|nr:portal vertex protein [uncultured Caudovirales phage]
MAELFGFEIKRKQEDPISFAPKVTDDGAAIVAEGGVYGTYVDLDGSIRTEAELVNRYREMALYPEVDQAIDDIVNEVITQEPEQEVVELILDDTDLPDRIKKLFIEEFKDVLKLLEFNQLSYEVFRRWYVDGRIYYHVITDEENPKNGIVELRYIDPRKIRKIKEQRRKKAVNNVPLMQDGKEYYIYNDKGFAKTAGNSSIPSNTIGGIRIAKDSIIHCTSGLTSINGDLVQSYLHKAIKPLNQLRSMEDSLVIYRISRAPERRIFYIDVGNLPKMKAEQYLRDIMIKFKNKLVYDAATGEVRDDRKFMTMLEDFWLPRREGGKGTEITTLPGGQNLGQMDDVIYFQRKLYKSLNVPISRLDPETQFNFGRATEITRDEVKFAKFISRLRNKFAILFTKIMERQLILKGIITPEEWDEIKQNVRYKFSQDNYYAELKETEILRDRMTMLRDIDDYAGKYYSHEWIRRHVLHQSDEEMEEIDEQIADEADNPQYAGPQNEADNAAPAEGGGQGYQPAEQPPVQ